MWTSMRELRKRVILEVWPEVGAVNWQRSDHHHLWLTNDEQTSTKTRTGALATRKTS